MPRRPTPAAEAGLIEFGARVRFRHPLVRSAAYRAALGRSGRSAHRALAEATDPGSRSGSARLASGPGRAGPDEDVAAELEHSAGRAQARGGHGRGGGVPRAGGRADARTRLAGRSGCSRRRRRSCDAGALDAALELLVGGRGRAAGRAAGRARWTACAAQIVFAQRAAATRAVAARARPGGSSRSTPDWPARPTSRRSARRSGPATWTPRRRAGGGRGRPRRAARARRRRARSTSCWTAFAIRLTEGYAAAAPTLTPGARAGSRSGRRAPAGRRAGSGSCRTGAIAALELWDDERWHALAARQVQLARDGRRARPLAVRPRPPRRGPRSRRRADARPRADRGGPGVAEATGNAPVAVHRDDARRLARTRPQTRG